MLGECARIRSWLMLGRSSRLRDREELATWVFLFPFRSDPLLILSKFPTVQPPIRRLERPKLFRHDFTYTPQSQSQDKWSLGCTALGDLRAFVRYFCPEQLSWLACKIIPRYTHKRVLKCTYYLIRYVGTFIDSLLINHHESPKPLNTVLLSVHSV